MGKTSTVSTPKSRRTKSSTDKNSNTGTTQQENNVTPNKSDVSNNVETKKEGQLTEQPQREKVIEMPLSELHPFKNHPFKILDDDAMRDMAESVAQYGVLVPAIVRPHVSGGYELVSGHRRKRACELAGKETMKVIIRELDDDEAIIIMVDSNLQRETLFFSEKAYAYKMKVEAVKRQSGRPKTSEQPLQENGSQIGVNSLGKKAYEIVGEQSGESKNQIYRYIRLTELVKELLDMVDEKKIGFNPAVEISYLKSNEQTLLLDAMEKEVTTPTLSQAQRLKKHSHEGTLTPEVIDEIMSEEKKEVLKVTLTEDRLKKYFPENTTPIEMENIIVGLLERWFRKRQENLQSQNG